MKSKRFLLLGLIAALAAVAASAQTTGGAQGTVTVDWTPPVTNVDGTPVAAGQITGYNIYQGPASSSGTCTTNATPLPAADKVASVGGSVVTWTSPTLLQGNYCFAITAVDASGESQQTNQIEAAIQPPPTPLTQPPGSVVVTVTITVK